MNQQEMHIIDVPEGTDEESAILQYMTGSVEGGNFWAYVAMRPSKYQDYIAKVRAGETINITEYGEILEQDWGDEAPDEVKARMAEEYGADDNFENELKAVADAMIEEHNKTNGN